MSHRPTASEHAEQRAPNRLRWSMYSMLLLITLCLGLAAWQSWHDEHDRASDAELINVAGHQRALSLQIGWLAAQPTDDGGALDDALELSKTEAQHIDQLLKVQTDAGIAALNPLLKQPVERWHAARERLWYRCEKLRRMQADGISPAAYAQAASKLRPEANASMDAADALVRAINAQAESKAATSLQHLELAVSTMAVMMLLLAVLVIEPTARHFKHQEQRIESHITEQEHERERLRTLLNALPTGLVVQDHTGHIIECNLAAENALMLNRSQLMGLASMDPRWHAVHDDGSPYPGEQHPIMRSLKNGASVRGETMGVIGGDGRQRWLLVNSEPLAARDGQITQAVACFLDVTDAREQRTMVSTVLEGAGIGTWYFYPATGERRWSETAASMLGYSLQEVTPWLSQWRARLLHPDDRPRIEAAMKAHLDDHNVPYRSEVRARHRDGHWVWIMAYGVAVDRDANGVAQRVVGIHIDISDRKAHELQLADQAMTDALTHLPNRAAVIQRLQIVIARHNTQATVQSHFALLFMDFDHFKQVNDTLGHDAGDELLRQIALRLQAGLRAGDEAARVAMEATEAASTSPNTSNYAAPSSEATAARLGGDEFVVVLDGLAHPDDAAMVAKRLLAALASPYDIHGHAVNSTASIGFVTSSDAWTGPQSLLRDADAAMYAAKRSGRGRVVHFEPSMAISHEITATA